MTTEPPAGDAMLAALGENGDGGMAGLFPEGLGSFLGGSATNPNGPPVPGPGDGDDRRFPRGDDRPGGTPQVPEPSPVDLLQIALALLAGLVYRRFRA
jgi:hypothetical protein